MGAGRGRRKSETWFHPVEGNEGRCGGIARDGLEGQGGIQGPNLVLPEAIKERLRGRVAVQPERKGAELEEKLEAASAKRDELLQRRCKRARELADNSEVAEKRHQARIHFCLKEAARTGRKRNALVRRSYSLCLKRNRAAQANARVDDLRKRQKEEFVRRHQELENRLKRAERKRTEFLQSRTATRRERGSSAYSAEMAEASKTIQRHWREFCASQRSTTHLARRFVASIGGDALLKSVTKALQSEPKPNDGDHIVFRQFDQFTKKVQQKTVILAAMRLLDRIESKAFRRNVQSPDKKLRNLLKSCMPANSKIPTKRYPVRVFLSAFMIVLFPEIVMGSTEGVPEVALKMASTKFVESFLCILSKFGSWDGLKELSSEAAKASLNAFDEKWVLYIEHFVSWKNNDVEALESALIGMACDLTLSALRKCGPDFNADHVLMSPDLTAITQQLEQDTDLIRSKIKVLSGEAGMAKMDAAVLKCKNDFDTITIQTDQYTKKSTKFESLGDLGFDSNGKKTVWKERVIRELIYDPNYEIVKVNDILSSVEFGANELLDCDRHSRDQSMGLYQSINDAFWQSMLDDMNNDSSFEKMIMVFCKLQDDVSQLCNIESNSDLDSSSEIEALASKESFDGEQFLKTSQKMFNALYKLGAQIREEYAMNNFTDLEEQLQSASENPAELTRVATRMLRFLYVLNQLLHADVINSQIRLLASIYTQSENSDKAFKYLESSFWKRQGKGEEHEQNDVEGQERNDDLRQLPKTIDWLHSASATASECAPNPEACDGAKKNPSLPQMRSGRMASLDSPVDTGANSLRNMKGIQRKHREACSCGIIQLMMKDQAVTTETLPEILDMEQERVLGLQNAFQRLLVLSACCLLLHQLIEEKNPPQKVEEQKRSFIQRFKALLLHPETKMSDLGAEISSFVTQHRCNSIATSEESVSNLLNKLLDEESPPYESLKKTISSSLCTVVLSEDVSRSQLEGHIKQLLRRSAAAVLYQEVFETAEAVEDVAAVACKVHKDTLAKIIN